jgi:hypothetical protein
MRYRRPARETLTAVELQHGDTLEFTLADGARREIAIEDSGAEILETTCRERGVEEPGAMTSYRFWCDARIDGVPLRMEREVGTARTFYEPWEAGGVRLWLDAVDAVFDFMRETHGACRLQENFSHHGPPRRQVRLALQDASLRICPEKVHAWCPLPEGGLRMGLCYRGEDCWMGAYDGASAHGGLDVNHPRGTSLFAPVSLDDQFLFHRVADGHNNNRWHGIRRWPDGSEWILRSAHMVELTVPERTPLAAGQPYARGAGVWVGAVEHSHFGFAVHADGETVRLDPWILFRQAYLDRGPGDPPLARVVPIEKGRFRMLSAVPP